MAARATAKNIVNTDTSTVASRTINGVKLESIPLPDAMGRGQRAKYPFAEMQIGESFEFVGDKLLANIRNAMGKYQTNHPDYRFATRTVGEREVESEHMGVKTKTVQKVYRCWRIEAKVTNG